MPSIDEEIQALRALTTGQLRTRYAEVAGELPRSRHKEHLVRRIAWRLQADAAGGLSQRALQQAAALAREQDLRIRPPGARAAKTRGSAPPPPSPPRDHRLPLAGTILVRRYRGSLIQVRVLEQGFEYENAIYPSLTAVAKHVTRKHWNGFHFFGLAQKEAPK